MILMRLGCQANIVAVKYNVQRQLLQRSKRPPAVLLGCCSSSTVACIRPSHVAGGEVARQQRSKRSPAVLLSCSRMASTKASDANCIWSRPLAGEKQRYTRPLTVLLLGYAGSPRRHLDQFADLYAQLGLPSVCCILPQEAIFHYDIERIRHVASAVLSTADVGDSRAPRPALVVHTFSNNGAAVYQQCYQLLAQRQQLNRIQGLILDSGPGPMSVRDNCRHFYAKSGPFNNTISPLFFPMALFAVNMANKVPLRDNIKSVGEQIRLLRVNWRRNRAVPWPGSFVTSHDEGGWPLLFLYSSKDPLIPWRYVEAMAGAQQQRGRPVTLKNFQSSGHVAHYKQFPDEYRRLVDEFLRGLPSIS